MNYYSKDGITVASIIDPRRMKSGEKFPVKICVTYQRKRKYYPTGKVLTLKEWNDLAKSKIRILVEIRESIENSFSHVRNNVIDLADKMEFSFDLLDIRLGKATGSTLNNLIMAKINLLRNEERIGSMQYYEGILRTLRLFAGENIKLSMVTPTWLKKLETHMLIDKGYTTISMHMRGIRAMMNEAKSAGMIKESAYPFGKGKYLIPESETKKKALTIEQVGQIARYSDGLETTDRYRDLWIFIYLCNGMNVTDLANLRYKNISDGEINYIRQKTKRTARVRKEISIVITPEVEKILSRWGNKDIKPENYIFPYLEGITDPIKVKNSIKDLTKRINKRMKVIGAALGIDSITTYTARHSYATVLKRSGASIAYISESLGHNDLKTTETYLASFERKEREKNANLLTQF